MKIFVWNYVQECSDNYHREGGVVVFAENEDRARELANTRNGCNIQANEKPDDIRDVSGGNEAVYIMHDTGCSCC